MTPRARAVPSRPAAATSTAHRRIETVDLLRGLVMVIMLLDHTREFFHAGALLRDPTDLATTTPGLFATRWITHFCAPVFILLAGVSVALQVQGGTPRREVSRFLWTRGLWLVVLELTVIRFGALFNLDYSLGTPLQVFWVLGASMIVMAALIHLPAIDIGVGALAVIVLHNVFDRVHIESWGGPGTPVPGLADQLGTVLHQPGLISGGFFVLYPLIPWVAVMAAGYWLGTLWTLDRDVRRRRLVIAGVACLVVFVALRTSNLYGDPLPWSVQPRGRLYTVLSYLNVMKYPPSLLFLAITLGPALLFLAWLERKRDGRVGGAIRELPSRALITLGTVPLFFYVMQWYVAHLLSWAAHVVAGKPTGHMTLGAAAHPSLLREAGFELPVVYLAWAVGLVILYPLCHWFAGVKRRRREWWIRYL